MVYGARTWDKALVTGVTYPLAQHYGYFSAAGPRSEVPLRAQPALQETAPVSTGARHSPSNHSTLR